MGPALQDTVALLGRLVGYPTVSADSNTEMIADLATRLEAVGARVETHLDPTGHKANLFATLGPDGDGGIVLSGHTDVVPAPAEGWTGDPFRMRQADGRLYGRGTADMKGFIAAAVALAPTYAAARLTRPLHFAFTHDEEVGCFGAQALVAMLAARGLRPAMAIVGEPTGMAVVEAHKGCCEYSTHFVGLSGHGSDPGAGVNAVEYAARFVMRLMDLRVDLIAASPPGSPFRPPWTTLNVGAVAGGTGHNVIADAARVDWEMRPVATRDMAHVKKEVATFCDEVLLPEMRVGHPGAQIRTETIAEIAGLEPVPENAAVAVMAALTGASGAGTVAFGTEAGLYARLGLHAVVCGPGHIAQAHRPDEYVEVAQLDRCLAALRGLAAHL